MRLLINLFQILCQLIPFKSSSSNVTPDVSILDGVTFVEFFSSFFSSSPFSIFSDSFDAAAKSQTEED